MVGISVCPMDEGGAIFFLIALSVVIIEERKIEKEKIKTSN